MRYLAMHARGQSLVLIGMMGAGKSSVGRLLQHRTGLTRLDTDEAITEKFGLSIPEIFAKLGEEKFRDAETEILQQLDLQKPAIVVTGGGIVGRAANIERLKQLGLVIWLEADEAILFERASRRANRPLLQTDNPQARLAALLQQRAPQYESAADIRIDTSHRSHDNVAELILREIEQRRAGSE